jgi:hypothetical protein
MTTKISTALSALAVSDEAQKKARETSDGFAQLRSDVLPEHARARAKHSLLALELLTAELSDFAGGAPIKRRD